MEQENDKKEMGLEERFAAIELILDQMEDENVTLDESFELYKKGMEQMKAADGVTEELKRTHQMEWVQRCNNIHNRAEEIVLHEMIYS